MAVLLADTELSHMEKMYGTLKKLGIPVVVTDDGHRAAQHILDRRFSLILVDVELPGRNGFEILEQVRKAERNVPVILLSANGGVNKAVEAIKKGAADFLIKPVEPGILEELVKAYLPADNQGNKGKVEASGESGTKRSIERPIITSDPQMIRILEIAEKIASSPATVLIRGESGTGKELLARYIHAKSNRKEKPFVAVNCAALPESLLESELFGYEKGAFTGASGRRIGKFELANGGTILLDEISEIPINLQAKLLRVLQESEIDRIGGSYPVPIDVRVIATTNVDLEEAVEEKEFRRDLYYRLNVISLELPPLRNRKKDIVLLAKYFVEKFNRLNGTSIKGITPEAERMLTEYEWGGNVRELENAIHRAVLLTSDDFITPDVLQLSSRYRSRGKEMPLVPLKEMERILIERALEETSGNRTRAAKVLGISVRTLRNKLSEYRKSAEYNDATGSFNQ